MFLFVNTLPTLIFCSIPITMWFQLFFETLSLTRPLPPLACLAAPSEFWRHFVISKSHTRCGHIVSSSVASSLPHSNRFYLTTLSNFGMRAISIIPRFFLKIFTHLLGVFIPYILRKIKQIFPYDLFAA